jgi:hypothetical protein
MDHPGQGIANSSCHKQRKQRVSCHPLGHGSLPLTNVPLCLRILFSCLPRVVLTSAVHVAGCFRRLIGNIVQGFPHLIQNLLSGVLLRWASLISR